MEGIENIQKEEVSKRVEEAKDVCKDRVREAQFPFCLIREDIS
jgi:hypothetical protein